MTVLHFEQLERRDVLSALGTIDTHHDSIPLFGHDGEIMSTGPWINGAVDYRIPSGVTVAIDDLDASARNILVEGTLRFNPTVDTRLLAETILVMPSGRLEVAPKSGVSSEIVIADAPLDLAVDPEQYGHGILVLGAAEIRGANKTDFVRLAQEPHAGDTTLRLSEAAVGWQVGDILILPDTRQLMFSDGVNVPRPEGGWSLDNNANPQDERLTVASVSGDGLTIQLQLQSRLQFDHLGARGATGTLRYLPHVANMTRSITIRSENPDGVRGHFFATEDAQIEIENASFVEMGRTTAALLTGNNHVGRYALHLHHLSNESPFLDNGERFLISGNVIDGSPRWGIAVHDTHYGRVVDNVVYDAVSAGIVQEDGSETGNEFLNNFVIRNDGSGYGIDKRESTQDFGHEGSGFWMRSWNETVFVGNVASGAQFDGFVIFANAESDHIPLGPGSDLVRSAAVSDLAPSVFRDNEVYGASRTALDLWYTHNTNFTIEDFAAWHISNTGLQQLYPVGAVHIDGFTAMFDPTRLDRTYAANGIIATSNFMASNIEISGGHIGIHHNPSVRGRKAPQNVSRFDHLRLANEIDFLNEGGSIDGRPQRTDIIDALFAGGGLVMRYQTPRPPSTKTVFGIEEVYVQILGDDRVYRAWYDAQRPDFIVPETVYARNGKLALEGAPWSGMTNDEVFAEIGKAVGGEIMVDDAFQVGRHLAWFSLVD